MQVKTSHLGQETQSNQVTKQFNYTIIEMTCVMLLSTDVLSAFWAKVLSFAIYVNNCTSTKAKHLLGLYMCLTHDD